MMIQEVDMVHAKSTKLAIDGGEPYRTKPFPERTPFDEREIELVTEAIRSQNLFWPQGDKVFKFEESFAELYGTKYAVASSSGTAAIHVAIGAINPEPGDEIITAPLTDLGSIVPIIYQGLIPVFADVDDTYNMDPADVERKITPRTKAILVVHLCGNPCDMDAMVDIAKRHNLWLIEDCAEAHLAEYKGQLVGTIGDIGCFSFQQSKHMTTGDGGMTISNNDSLSQRLKLFVDKGWLRWRPEFHETMHLRPREYLFLAPCYRMTELQGAVGLAQLEKVQNVVKRRTELGDYLTQLLMDIDGIIPAPVTPGATHTYWNYVIRQDDLPAAVFAEALHAEGIPASVWIGQPVYLDDLALKEKKTFGTSGYPFDGSHGGREIEYTEGLCPNAERLMRHMVAFWFNVNWTRDDMRDVAGAVRKVMNGFRVKQSGGV
jgi:perosamine synthetase